MIVVVLGVIIGVLLLDRYKTKFREKNLEDALMRANSTIQQNGQLMQLPKVIDCSKCARYYVSEDGHYCGEKKKLYPENCGSFDMNS